MDRPISRAQKSCRAWFSFQAASNGRRVAMRAFFFSCAFSTPLYIFGSACHPISVPARVARRQCLTGILKFGLRSLLAAPCIWGAQRVGSPRETL